MPVKHKKSENMTRAKYECDGCGKVDFWDDDWFWYGSIAKLEDEPEIIITVCSNTCQNKFDRFGKKI